MMIKQRKHNIRNKKSNSTSLIKIEESSICNNKIRLEEVKPEETPNLYTQSTPKRHDSNYSNKSQDGSDSPDYRSSFPLTQDENIEVTWDWNSAAQKNDNDNSKKSSDITTPKRTAIIRRKRPPSSPLFYKPIRKQLIKRENTEGIEQFKAEMIALTKQINNNKNYSETIKSNDKIGTIIDASMKIRFNDIDDEADTNNIIDDKDLSLKIDNQEDNKSVDDLFNDSMDEVIIKFSQETEKKLNISPTGNINNGNSESLINNDPSPNSNYLLKLKSNGSSNSVNIGTLNENNNNNDNVNTRIVSQPQKLLNKNRSSSRISRTPEKQTLVKTDDIDLFIPDDSFDDFLVSCDSTETKNISKNNLYSSTVKRVGIQTSSNINPIISTTMKLSNEFLPKVPSTSILKPHSNLSKNNTTSINSLIKNPTKVQIGLGNKYLATKTSGPQIRSQKITKFESTVTPTRTWKFFKSKSHSDSNFDCSDNPTGKNVKQGLSESHDSSRTNSSSSLKSGSNSNTGSKGSRVYGGKAVSNADQTIQRAWTSSSLDSNVPESFNNQKDNVNMYNVNRYRAEKGNGENKYGNEESQHQSNSITSSMQSMQITRTPEEIERNRIEAMQKLEARKRRLQAANATINSSSTIISSSISNTQRIPVESVKSYEDRPVRILGIETSCDDTGIAIVDGEGKILGEALNCQQNIHIKHGGIVPNIARDLHKDNIQNVYENALLSAQITLNDVDAIATTVKPGLPLSLLIGVNFGKKLSKMANKPFIPIHHMEAHALTARMTEKIDFPFLTLLISGGNCLLALVENESKFYRIGVSLDDAPGEAFDKVARRLKIHNIPEYQNISSGQAIELAATKATNPKQFTFPVVLPHSRCCNFSFAGLKTFAKLTIEQQEQKFNTAKNEIIPNYENFCAAFQWGIARHIAIRLKRAMIFCDIKNLIPHGKYTLYREE
ncbi:putative uncharacterized protein DDB_G0286901 isoform X2 [Chelonus insularis]|uniref:putative uncharacterized protein DDB_G0286901 isoform X2 n=1 Tax=Chelonus insularis TaxID=460826 RepID=UPI00158D7467|nr:putative uncharacterized protein DDB_G0286901 isoform X2 [Chelonus insularis]